MTEKILFRGPYNKETGFLSNFYEAPFILLDVTWPTVEHYFQAMKFRDPYKRIEILKAATPAEARKLGRAKDLAFDADLWESKKDTVMVEAVKQKFSQNRELLDKLLATGTAELAEDSPWDQYWGIGKDGKGENRMGHILMEVREHFRTMHTHSSILNEGEKDEVS